MSFHHEWMLNFIKCSFYFYLDDHIIFAFSFVNVLDHIACFVFVEPSLEP